MDQLNLDQPSRLLQLPREIRNLIYEHVLVRDVIPVESAVVNLPRSRFSRSRAPSFCEGLHEMYPSRRPHVHRRIWSVPAFDIDVAFTDNSRNDPKVVHMTYQLADSHASYKRCGVEIRLLQVCKQVYYEATDIFYSKNTFSFMADYRIATIFAFLCERPAASLLHIRSLELALTEDNNMRGTTQAHYPITRRSTDSQVIQYAYHHFTDLCTLMSTPRMQLRKLHLTIDTLAARNGIAPGSIQECLQWEKHKTSQQRPWIASWVDPLLKVEGLESLTVYWIFDRPRLRRMSDTLSMMQQHMLTTKQHKTPVRKDSVIGTDFKFRMLHQGDSESNVYVHYVPPVKIPRWREHYLTDDGIRTIEEMNRSRTAQEMITRHQHIQDVLAASEGVYVCYCELRNA
ncbi:Nn.00g052290.m01.CDS01 [Neocucurbitaria sp. VM-36]